MSLSESKSDNRYLIISYLPTSLFSLRISFSTNKGAKTLLCPSPYTIKCALISNRIRSTGLKDIEEWIKKILSLKIAIKPPNIAIVQNTFTRILDPKDPKNFASTIGFREYIFFKGEISIAFEVNDWNQNMIKELREVAVHINYFGKKGSFFTFFKAEIANGKLDDKFSIPGVTPSHTHSTGIIQMLDDFSPDCIRDKKIWQKISPFFPNDLTKTQRESKPTFLPYRLMKTTKNYSFYQIMDK